MSPGETCCFLKSWKFGKTLQLRKVVMCDITSNKMEKATWNNSFQNMRGLWDCASGLKNFSRKSVVMKNNVLCFFSSFFKEGSTSSKLRQSQSYQSFPSRHMSQALGCSPLSPLSFFFSESLLWMIQIWGEESGENCIKRLQTPTHVLLKLHIFSATDTTSGDYNKIYDQNE